MSLADTGVIPTARRLSNAEAGMESGRLAFGGPKGAATYAFDVTLVGVAAVDVGTEVVGVGGTEDVGVAGK